MLEANFKNRRARIETKVGICSFDEKTETKHNLTNGQETLTDGKKEDKKDMIVKRRPSSLLEVP